MIFNASAKSSDNEILLVVVLPPNIISSPFAASAILILSQSISPTLVILPSFASNPPAPNKPVAELKDKLELVFNARSPVASVANVTKQVVSLDSFANVISVAVPPPPPPPPPLVNDTHDPPFRPWKSEPVHWIVPLAVPVALPSIIPPFTSNFSPGEVVPIPTKPADVIVILASEIVVLIALSSPVAVFSVQKLIEPLP